MLERLQAFRELIRHGHSLLGDVVAYCHDAESALAQFAAEKEEMDRLRAELTEAQARVSAESEAARLAVAQVESQRRELVAMRSELVTARQGVEEIHRTQNASAAALEQSLRDARQQQLALEQELQRVRVQAGSARSLEARLGELDAMESRLRATEGELNATRLALVEERSRRDRAIALIKPREVAPA